jgi:hypothetical protein
VSGIRRQAPVDGVSGSAKTDRVPPTRRTKATDGVTLLLEAAGPEWGTIPGAAEAIGFSSDS